MDSHVNTHNQLITEKTAWTTGKNIACLGVENIDDHATLTNDPENQHVFHVDRINYPNVRPTKDTRGVLGTPRTKPILRHQALNHLVLALQLPIVQGWSNWCQELPMR